MTVDEIVDTAMTKWELDTSKRVDNYQRHAVDLAVRLTIEACAKVADEYQRHNSHSCPREIAKRIRAILNNGAQHGQR